MTRKNGKISVCLAGGGAAGASQAGALSALYTYFGKRRIKAISGASIGTLNAAIAAQGDVEKLEELWSDVSSSKVFSKKKILYPCSDSYLDVTPLKNLIRKEVDFQKLRNSKTQVFINATECGTGKQITVSNHDFPKNEWPLRLAEHHIFQALMASTALPIIFPRVKVTRWTSLDRVTHHVCEDGGITDNTPLKPLIDNGANTIFVLYCHPKPKSGGYSNTQALKTSRTKRIPETISLLFQANQNKDVEHAKYVNKLVELGELTDKRKVEIIEIYPKNDIGTLEFDSKKSARVFRAEERNALDFLHHWGK